MHEPDNSKEVGDFDSLSSSAFHWTVNFKICILSLISRTLVKCLFSYFPIPSSTATDDDEAYQFHVHRSGNLVEDLATGSGTYRRTATIMGNEVWSFQQQEMGASELPTRFVVQDQQPQSGSAALTSVIFGANSFAPPPSSRLTRGLLFPKQVQVDLLL